MCNENLQRLRLSSLFTAWHNCNCLHMYVYVCVCPVCSLCRHVSYCWCPSVAARHYKPGSSISDILPLNWQLSPLVMQHNCTCSVYKCTTTTPATTTSRQPLQAGTKTTTNVEHTTSSTHTSTRRRALFRQVCLLSRRWRFVWLVVANFGDLALPLTMFW